MFYQCGLNMSPCLSRPASINEQGTTQKLDKFGAQITKWAMADISFAAKHGLYLTLQRCYPVSKPIDEGGLIMISLLKHMNLT